MVHLNLVLDHFIHLLLFLFPKFVSLYFANHCSLADFGVTAAEEDAKQHISPPLPLHHTLPAHGIEFISSPAYLVTQGHVWFMYWFC